MSPLERAVEVQNIEKVSIQCGKCATLIAFDIAKTPYYAMKDACPFCAEPWESLEKAVIMLREAIIRAKEVSGHRIRVQLKDSEV